jgi:hypothetical protein
VLPQIEAIQNLPVRHDLEKKVASGKLLIRAIKKGDFYEHRNDPYEPV